MEHFSNSQIVMESKIIHRPRIAMNQQMRDLFWTETSISRLLHPFIFLFTFFCFLFFFYYFFFCELYSLSFFFILFLYLSFHFCFSFIFFFSFFPMFLPLATSSLIIALLHSTNENKSVLKYLLWFVYFWTKKLFLQQFYGLFEFSRFYVLLEWRLNMCGFFYVNICIFFSSFHI